MLRNLRSYFAGLKASSALGRALQLQRKGKNLEALLVAREGLALLAKPYVLRHSATEGATLTTLTVLVEQLASETKEPGASHQDLQDSLAVLKKVSENPTPYVSEQLTWIPYLEARLGETH